jgi:hypothetical protein
MKYEMPSACASAKVKFRAAARAIQPSDSCGCDVLFRDSLNGARANSARIGTSPERIAPESLTRPKFGFVLTTCRMIPRGSYEIEQGEFGRRSRVRKVLNDPEYQRFVLKRVACTTKLPSGLAMEALIGASARTPEIGASQTNMSRFSDICSTAVPSAWCPATGKYRA